MPGFLMPQSKLNVLFVDQSGRVERCRQRPRAKTSMHRAGTALSSQLVNNELDQSKLAIVRAIRTRQR
ncbi:MAG: hypothetical protein NZ743_10935, partial [Pseudomonadales bacterium]|nr:hypothetical protein [Pseudomonadales bacterium]